MAATIIPPSFPSRRGQRAAAPTITISSDSDLSVPIINVSSSSEVSAPSPIDVLSSADSNEAMSRARTPARRQRPSSPVVRRSPVATVAASSDMTGATADDGRSQPARSAAPRRRPSSPVVRSRVAASSDISGGTADDARSQPARSAAPRRRPSLPVHSPIAASSDWVGSGTAADARSHLTTPRRRPSPPVRSPVAASSDWVGSGSAEDATSQPARIRSAAPRRRPSPPPPSGASGGATSQRKRKANSNSTHWSLEDDCELLATLADLRKGNLGEIPGAQHILQELERGERAFNLRGKLYVRDLSNKMCRLKEWFATTANMAAGNGGRLPAEAPHRDRVLFRASKKVWPDVFADGGAAYLEAKKARRRAKLGL